MATRFFSYTCFIALALVSTTHAGENWPSWRGPTGMGQSDEKNLPLTWGGKNQDNILWKAPLFPSDKVRRDQNQSCPIVWGQRVFVTLSYWPEGTEKDFPEHHVVCFDAKDGKKLWDTTIPPGPWKLTDLRGGYACPTPATDGQRVYVIFGSSVVAAVDFDGKIAWRKEINPYKFDVAIGASPILHQDTLIVVCDQTRSSKSSTIYAFDGKSGAIRWEKKRPNVDWAHSTPLLTKVNDKLQLITATSNGPHGLDPASGDTLWSFQASNQVGDTVTPIVRDGLLYVDSGRGGMGIAVDATGSGDVSKTHLKWKVPSVQSGLSSPLLVGDHLYRVHGSDFITCWKWTTGEEVFKGRLEGAETAASPIATADGRIYCVSGGKSYVLKAGPTLEILARNDLGDANKSSPAIAAGRIYIKGGRYLWCIGMKKD
jgi:outer membrane protein assembly factor BamB